MTGDVQGPPLPCPPAPHREPRRIWTSAACAVGPAARLPPLLRQGMTSISRLCAAAARPGPRMLARLPLSATTSAVAGAARAASRAGAGRHSLGSAAPAVAPSAAGPSPAQAELAASGDEEFTLVSACAPPPRAGLTGPRIVHSVARCTPHRGSIFHDARFLLCLQQRRCCAPPLHPCTPLVSAHPPPLPLRHHRLRHLLLPCQCIAKLC